MFTKKYITYLATILFCIGLGMLIARLPETFTFRIDFVLIVLGIITFIASNFVKKE